jgi:hypothetical protein
MFLEPQLNFYQTKNTLKTKKIQNQDTVSISKLLKLLDPHVIN